MQAALAAIDEYMRDARRDAVRARCSSTCARSARRARPPRSKTTSSAISASKASPARASTWPTRACIGKAPLPVRLTKRSNVDVEELAFFYAARGARCLLKPSDAAGARAPPSRCRARASTICKNVSLELPRDSLIVVTGLSGSGKSSLAFDTIYAEGQRRYMESLSTYAKRFVAQVAKPDVDFVFGLSPVISIEQKTIGSNPRSTVGTMTDIASYLNLLFATIAEPHCPRTGERVASRTRQPDPGSDPRRCPKARRSSCARRSSRSTARSWTSSSPRSARRAAGSSSSTASAWTSPPKSRSTKTTVKDMDAVVDRFVVGREAREGDQGRDRRHAAGRRRPACRSQVLKGAGKAEAERFYKGLCSPTHHFVYGGIEPEYFMFNNPESACRTCGGLGRPQDHASGAAGPRSASAASSAAASCARRSSTTPTPGTAA